MNQGCFVLGLSYTTSQHSVVIIALGPIVILLLASVMKLEKLTPSKILGMVISFAGIVFLETEHGSPTNSPLLVGRFDHPRRHVGLFALRRPRQARGALLRFDFDERLQRFRRRLSFSCRSPSIKPSNSIGKALAGRAGSECFYMAGVSAVLGYLLFYWLLRHMDASRVVVINYFQPVVVFLLSILILGERLTPRLSRQRRPRPARRLPRRTHLPPTNAFASVGAQHAVPGKLTWLPVHPPLRVRAPRLCLRHSERSVPRFCFCAKRRDTQSRNSLRFGCSSVGPCLRRPFSPSSAQKKAAPRMAPPPNTLTIDAGA